MSIRTSFTVHKKFLDRDRTRRDIICMRDCDFLIMLRREGVTQRFHNSDIITSYSYGTYLWMAYRCDLYLLPDDEWRRIETVDRKRK